MVYFTASCDTEETNKRFAESLSLDYPILSDPGKSVATAYGVVSKKRSFPSRHTFYIGPDGKILFVDRKVLRASRMRVPLVTDIQHGIVWIVGHAIGEAFRAHAGVEGVLILKARSLGEIG